MILKLLSYKCQVELRYLVGINTLQDTLKQIYKRILHTKWKSTFIVSFFHLKYIWSQAVFNSAKKSQFGAGRN